MLKIEVIKFEAQDVITASTAAPTEAPVECICDSTTWYHQAGIPIQDPDNPYAVTSEDHTRGDVKCPASVHPGCGEGGDVVN